MRVSVGEFFALPIAFVLCLALTIAFAVVPVWIAQQTHWTIAPILWVALLSLNYWAATRGERSRQS